MTAFFPIPINPANIEVAVGNAWIFSLGSSTNVAIQVETASGAAWGATVVELQLSLDGVTFYTNPYGASTFTGSAALKVFEVKGALFAKLVVTTPGTAGTKIIAKAVGINSN